MLADALRWYGYHVDMATTCAEALPLLAAQQYAAFFCEVTLHDTAATMVAAIRAGQPRLTIIVLTTHDALEVARHAVRIGAQDFLLKPYTARDLSAIIERTLERFQQNVEIREEQTEALLFQTVQALTTAIEAKDPYTAGHSQKVARLAAQFGLVLRLSPSDLFALRLGGLLHDIGKIGIPESILLKPGPLSDPEWEIMKQHPVIGASIVAQIGGLSHVSSVVEAHHERWDGQGYPKRLQRDEIPLLARILYIVDAYDAMTTDRAYRRSICPTAAMTNIRVQAGVQFDRELVHIFEQDVLPIYQSQQHDLLLGLSDASTPRTMLANLLSPASAVNPRQE